MTITLRGCLSKLIIKSREKWNLQGGDDEEEMGVKYKGEGPQLIILSSDQCHAVFHRPIERLDPS